MKIIADGHGYEWVEGWAQFADSPENRIAMAHHGLALTSAEELVAIAPDNTQVIFFGFDGIVRRSFDCDLVAGHGLEITQEQGREYLWIADCGLKLKVDAGDPLGFQVSFPRSSGEVIKVDVKSGAVVWRLPKPDHERYRAGEKYLPTGVVATPKGDIWVADGYGASLLHRFDRDGTLLATVSGEESEAGRLNQPHEIFIDYRKSEPELYVADRMNERVVVFDLEGAFRREVGKGLFAMPSAFATAGDLMFVGGLKARLSVLDLDDRLIGYIGDNPSAVETPGWPNRLIEGDLVQPRQEPGKFNSPHGLAADRHGNIYISEFVMGGRFVKLEAQSSQQ